MKNTTILLCAFILTNIGCNNLSKSLKLKGTWKVVSILPIDSNSVKDENDKKGYALSAVAFGLNGCDSITFHNDSTWCDDTYKATYEIKDKILLIKSVSNIDTFNFNKSNDTLLIKELHSKQILFTLVKIH